MTIWYPLHALNSRTHAFATAINEELMIAHETVNILEVEAAVRATDTMPIAVSARHLHLNEATLKQLFGAGARLTKSKEISQFGQFLCEQKVNLIGPKGRIDEFRLGVDAPVRASGETKNSAPITLERPSGKVDFDEGLIFAWRQIHITPTDAKRFGVESDDHAEVAISGDERDLIFQDVLGDAAHAKLRRKWI